MTTVVLIAAAYLTFVVFVLIVLTAGKRSDRVLIRMREAERGAAPAVLPGNAHLGRLAAELHDALHVERVAVVVSAPDESTTGQVKACLGAPGLLGRRLRVEEQPATRVLSRAEAATLGLGPAAEHEFPWAFAHVPIAAPDEVLGAVVVASHRPRAFSKYELGFIERLACDGAREFDRGHGWPPRETA